MRKSTTAFVVGAIIAAGAAIYVATPESEKGNGNAATNVGGAAVVAISPIDRNEVPSEECIGQPTCLRQWYQTLTWSVGPEEALVLLEAHGESSEKLKRACHDTTHAIGEVAAYMRTLSLAMELGDSNCGSGYYHDVIATTTTRVSPEKLAETLIVGCSGAGTNFAIWECFHGVGHGFVFAAGGDIYRGVETCLEIEDDHGRGACGSGAFMQELADHGTNEKYAADPYIVCKKMTEPIITGSCYDMLANLVRIHRREPKDQFQICEDLQKPYSDDCYGGLGRARFSGMPFEGSGIESYCNETPSVESMSSCYAAAFMNTSAYYGNSKEAASHCPELSTAALRKMCAEWFTDNPIG